MKNNSTITSRMVRASSQTRPQPMIKAAIAASRMRVAREESDQQAARGERRILSEGLLQAIQDQQRSDQIERILGVQKTHQVRNRSSKLPVHDDRPFRNGWKMKHAQGKMRTPRAHSRYGR